MPSCAPHLLLLQGQWMRLALSLRDRYNPDTALDSGSLGEGATGESIAQALADAFGRAPHITCKAG